jgi:cell division protein FtsB
MQDEPRRAAVLLAAAARAAIPPRLARRYRDSASFRRHVHRAARWGWLAVFAWVFVFGDHGAAALAFRWARVQMLEREVATRERREAWLQREVERREKDRDTLERLARERYGMAYPNEKVYRIVEVTRGEARKIAAEQRRLAKDAPAD